MKMAKYRESLKVAESDIKLAQRSMKRGNWPKAILELTSAMNNVTETINKNVGYILLDVREAKRSRQK